MTVDISLHTLSGNLKTFQHENYMKSIKNNDRNTRKLSQAIILYLNIFGKTRS